MRTIAWVLLLGMSVRCSSPPPAGRGLSAEAAPAPVSPIASLPVPGADRTRIIYSSSRWAAAEPCGCSLRPLGGLKREWNALRELRAQQAGATLLLYSGPTFVPSSSPAKKLAVHRKRAEVLAEALSTFDIAAFSPSAADFALGAPFLLSLSKKAKFPFTSANVVSAKTGKPFFPPYLELDAANGQKILVIGLSAQPKREHRSAQVKVLPAKTALKNVFKKAKGKYGLVAVLSTINSVDWEKLSKAFPQVNLVLGGDGEDRGLSFQQEAQTFVRAEPPTLGKVLSVFDVKVGGPPTQLYSEATANTIRASIRAWENEAVEFSRKIDDNPSAAPSAIKYWKGEAERFRALVARHSELTREKPGATPYHSALVELDNAFETSDNPMVAVMDRLAKINP
jgi:2',3'-cyclic-nucleotide 2'-phosphodiesterase (5'-nucleotidase family)